MIWYWLLAAAGCAAALWFDPAIQATEVGMPPERMLVILAEVAFVGRALDLIAKRDL